ncbi:MAG: hypothetical protein JWN25_2003 [Verrucomicrobiales bacterium]|nr:hypothetical protein [Verrucomicrobiales bacterium]MDB6130678.1 hypothetical protein [Verrucomicrobiales bacterium]
MLFFIILTIWTEHRLKTFSRQMKPEIKFEANDYNEQSGLHSTTSALKTVECF